MDFSSWQGGSASSLSWSQEAAALIHTQSNLSRFNPLQGKVINRYLSLKARLSEGAHIHDRNIVPSRKTLWIEATKINSVTGVSQLECIEEEEINISDSMISQNLGGVKGAWAQAQLRATFYPKFENEKSDQEIRMKVIEVVGNESGLLEVTLKHSGSLFMYSGEHGGAFAKNSLGNLYTAVGVFVLGRTMQEAWGSLAMEKQREFNAFLEKHHICISMELVTAVLGDHGQRPLKDYVVVTAVTELRGKPRFYSTPDLIAFCRYWRLPTNHVWLFSSRKTAAMFFSAYDALCEDGTASSVTKVLDEIADISVPASKSHVDVQGEILEGLVARIVMPRSIEKLQEALKRYPVRISECPPASGPSLREICAANKASENQKIMALLQNAENICSDWSDWMLDDTAEKKSISSFYNKFLLAKPVDHTTVKLKEQFNILNDRKMRVRFPCHPCTNTMVGKLKFKMVIHVLSDSVFRKYNKEMRSRPGLWPLYRGFFVEITLFDEQAETLMEPYDAETKFCSERSSETAKFLHSVEDDKLADESENLMVKLKFLPYKIRTFLIRNGLSILFEKGLAAYRQYYFRQMEIWGTSREKQRQLDHLLMEWAEYITKKYKGKKLSSQTYLSEAEPFLEQYAARSMKNLQLVGAAGSHVIAEDLAEDFLALDIVDDGDDTAVPESSNSVDKETSKHSYDKTKLKAKGILVFFPGIPGCGKSALCHKLLNIPGGFGDDRPIYSLMGDLVKGRYWPQLAEKRRKQPSSITLADKNAPNEEVWKQIEEICQSTHAIGVPVISDSEGTKSNPFSIDALAVFIHRVLQRENHPGNLDAKSPNLGFVLLMFYNLYEGKDKKEFEEILKRRFGHIVRMPLLPKERPAMRPPVTEVLLEGIDLFQRHRAKHKKLDSSKGSFKAEWADWERRLKEIMLANAEFLDSIQVPFDEAVWDVRQQLETIAKGDNFLHFPVEDDWTFRRITFAAVSLPPNEVIEVLTKVSKSNEAVHDFLCDKCLESNLKVAHVTLAHKRSHGVPAVAAFGAFSGVEVSVQFTAFLFSEKLCALEVQISSPHNEIISYNKWPHLTVWTAEGTPPKEANNLPQLVSDGQAIRFDFSSPFTVLGVVQLF